MILSDSLNRDIKIVSFDIFDTIITRTVGEPKGIFDLLSYQLQKKDIGLPDRLRTDFTAQRIEAERRARLASRKEDIKINDIYNFLLKEFNLSKKNMAKIMSMEIKAELEFTTAVPMGREFISQARNNGKKIIFISDMYLPRSVIMKMLEKVDASSKFDNIYVSGEIGLLKRSGKLYEYVLKNENCLPSEILHIGDHPTSDYRIPLKLGINAIHYDKVHLNRYERTFLSESKIATYPEKQFVAGAARKARISNDINSNKNQSTIYKIGANIAGPIIFFFVLWVLQEAKIRKIKRLYFMARDGQIMFKVAQELISKIDFCPEIRYLYGSRQAFNLPSIITLEEDEIDWIIQAEPFLSIRTLSLRLKLSPEALVQRIGMLKLKTMDLDEHLSISDIHAIQECLLHNDALRQFILKHAAFERNILIDYLKQEKLTGGDSVALVDSGWYANSQTRLEKILNVSNCCSDLYGFYFGLRSNSSDGRKVSYLFNTNSPNDFRSWGKAFITIFEILCSADHGMTTGYIRSDHGFVLPMLKESTNRIALGWGIKTLRCGIENFINSSCFFVDRLDPLEYRGILLKLIRLLISKPEIDAAYVLGSFPFSSEQTEQEMSCLAPVLSIQNIIASLTDWSGRKRRSLTFWPEASILRSNSIVRAMIPLPLVRTFIRFVERL